MMQNTKIYRRLMLLIPFVVFILALFQSCSKDEDQAPALKAGFSFEYVDNNTVRFTNLSEGGYYLLDWDFGNGETVSNSLKNKTYDIYYAQAGTYTVSLTIVDFDGNRNTATQTVNISRDDLVIAFSATPDSRNPNRIHLENNSQGSYDAFRWLFRNKTVENENTPTAYFPFKGEYEIELQLIKGNDVYSTKKNITIASDDHNYLSTFTLTWADEFDGNSVNTADWTFETGATGWGNNELQNYTNGNNAEVKDGKLMLTARKVNDNQAVGSYTSARMMTKNKREFLYGRMEIRAKLPSGRGIWPAIWMLGANISQVSWPACGEIDIMEYVGYQPNTVHSTVHTPAGYGVNGNGKSKTLETAEEEFHVYGLLWTEKELIFYTDSIENVTHTYAPATKNSDNWPFDKAQYFIFNVAVGGNWGGAQGIDDSIFPQTMEIDYIRVFQPEE